MKKIKKEQFSKLPINPKNYGYIFKPTKQKEEGSDYSENEIILLYYIFKNGYGNLFVKNVRHLSFYMGRSIGSIKQQLSNIDYMINRKGLTDYSKMMDRVHLLLNNEPKEEILDYINTFMYNTQFIRYMLLKKQNVYNPLLCKLVQSVCYGVR